MTIRKTPVRYRMAFRGDKAAGGLELTNAQPYGASNVGSSAFYAALRRNLEAELATAVGEAHASIFNEYAFFVFDGH